MDLVESLRSFCAVAAERNFTRGAERCGQPQPVASRRIAALESRLGTSLLVRTSRRVELTPDGEQLLPLAQDLLARVERIDRCFDGASPGLVIAVPAALDTRARAAIRRGLRVHRVAFATDPPSARAEQLRSGAAQLALIPVASDIAEIRVPLGVAHHVHQRSGGKFFLDQLRRPVRQRDASPRAVHVLEEDNVPVVRDPLREACYAVGLRADQVIIGMTDEEAWTRAHERDDVVLATAREADREQLAWSDLRGPALCRGYRLMGDAVLDLDERAALLRRLATGLDGTVHRSQPQECD